MTYHRRVAAAAVLLLGLGGAPFCGQAASALRPMPRA